ncbi:MAG: AAA family ATPase [Candidatus Omnitrophica bacterium]|nr:AAA family ATPase [Candidatus Omnitrophota bacterium]
MAHLIYGIRQRLGFLLITGEVGTGKTTLAKALVDQVGDPARTALILNPSLSGTELLKAALRDFGVQLRGSTRGDFLRAIERFLLAQADRGGISVLIVDEAQAVSPNALEQVRLLSNIETAKEKLLQIVLVGQPEVEERLLRDPRLRALNQRIAVRYRIDPLSDAEVGEYIEHRLRIASRGNGAPTFTPAAILRIAAATGGIPRRINLLCDRVLLSGFVRESKTLHEAMVEEVLKEKEERNELDCRCTA